MTIAEKIIDLRIRSGMTQEQFAEKASLDLEQLKAVENGERLPDEDMRVAISQAFELSAHELTPDVSEQEDYDRQSEQENDTVDTKLPYNPFFREGNGDGAFGAGTAVVADKTRLFRNAGIKICFIPLIIVSVIQGLLSFASIAIYNTFFYGNIQNVKVNLFSIGSLIVTVISLVLDLFFAKKYYLKAFTDLGKADFAKRSFPLFFAVQYALTSLLSYAINAPTRYHNTPAGPQYYDLDGMTSTMLHFVLLTVTLIVGTVLSIIVIISLLHLFDKFSQEGTQIENKYFTGYILIACAAVAVLIISIIFGKAPTVLTAVRLAVELAVTVFALYLIKHREKLSDEKILRTLPIIAIVIVFLLLVAGSVLTVVETAVK